MDTNLNVRPDIKSVTPDDPARYQAELRKAAEEFEGIFLAQLYQIMNQTVHKSDLFGDVPGQDIYKDMFMTEVARMGSLAQEIGVAELLFQSLGGDAPARPEEPGEKPDPDIEGSEISEVKNATTKRIGTFRHP